jgi:hypothetical protein
MVYIVFENHERYLHIKDIKSSSLTILGHRRRKIPAFEIVSAQHNLEFNRLIFLFMTDIAF